MNKKIYICGDIHGSWKPIRDFYNHMDKISPLTNETIMIMLGDFGANYFLNYRDKEFKEKLKSYKTTFFVIRGNHEERPSICRNNTPNDWHMEVFWNNAVYVENDYPYIKYALDYPAIYEIPTAQDSSIRALVLPGAYSVDKDFRLLNGWSWFSQEQCNAKERKIGTDLALARNYDLVLSHTCPLLFEPTDLFLPMIDQFAVDKTTERWLGEIEYKMNYKLWCFGHFHSNRIYPEYNGKQMLMLSNDCLLDVYKYFCGNYNIYDSLIKVSKNTNIDKI